jgi:diaminopimelate decarboxylase
VPIAEAFRAFAARHGSELRLELEPDVSRGERRRVGGLGHRRRRYGREGYRFVKTDTGMTEILRPSLYGAQHPIESSRSGARSRGTPSVSWSVIAAKAATC